MHNQIKFKAGQKWISNAEPDLGMGRVQSMEHRQVTIYFDLVEEERTYARQEAPLTRVKFTSGDEIKTRAGSIVEVLEAIEEDSLYTYRCSDAGTVVFIHETELDPNVRFNKPEERLFTHQIDDNRWFNLRYHSLERIAHLATTQSRGLYGARVSLIPHQLYIASEVASRFAPRVLLADEVGLGKTIEAGLIIHQQLQTGRASRILVVVPPALTFQWFVEMIRRFNLQFTVLDEERCQQISADNSPLVEDEDDESQEERLEPEDTSSLQNPFHAQQLVLCSLDLFTENSKRLNQAVDSRWDLIVVDEAHHLKWTPEAASEEYMAIEALSAASTGLLLLTATPEQLGRTGHFARLRLLDPHRYHDYDAFLAEESTFESVADAVNSLLTGKDEVKSEARKAIISLLGTSDERTDDQLMASLLDRHGTGRVLFRNVRSSVKGFPQRKAVPVPLHLPEEYKTKESWFPEVEFGDWTSFDTRVKWLIETLSDASDKFLVICAHQQTAIALEHHIKNRTTIRSTVFHEGMDLVARDRSANYFSDTYKGAQVMICSEIGSEGRNFQFASNLVLFDLPLGPDLLEQRIGRLDRIGQKNDVTLYIPYFENAKNENLFRWYHEAMDLFSEPNPVGQNLFDELFAKFSESTDLTAFLSSARESNLTRLENMSRGRDRLLELNSHQPDRSARIVEDILSEDASELLQQYMELSFEVFGLESEPLGDGVFNVKPTETMVRNTSVSLETQGHSHYPELPEEGVLITYNRATALTREDVSFFTWENPMVQQALDVILSDVTGNSAMIVIKHPDFKAGTLLLESLHVVNCIAPAEIMSDRFMPPQVLRSLINPDLQDISTDIRFNEFREPLKVPADTLRKILDSQVKGINNMLASARTIATEKLDAIKVKGQQKMESDLDMEIERLQQLMLVNNNVRAEELEFLQHQKEALHRAIEQTSMRLDALRILVCA